MSEYFACIRIFPDFVSHAPKSLFKKMHIFSFSTLCTGLATFLLLLTNMVRKRKPCGCFANSFFKKSSGSSPAYDYRCALLPRVLCPECFTQTSFHPFLKKPIPRSTASQYLQTQLITCLSPKVLKKISLKKYWNVQSGSVHFKPDVVKHNI